MSGSDPSQDDIYQFGDVYDTLEICDGLNAALGRLGRKGLMDEAELAQCRQSVADVQSRLERVTAKRSNRSMWRRLLRM